MKKTKAMLIALLLITMTSVCLGQSYLNRSIGSIGYVNAHAIAATSDGNFIVAGSAEYSGPGGYSNALIMKIKSNGDTVWTKIFRRGARSGFDQMNVVTSTSDGNFIVAGSAESDNLDENTHIYLIKIKSNGDTLWTRAYWTSDYCFAINITSTTEGNSIVCGYSKNLAYLLKINQNGDTVWTRTYGESGNIYANAIEPTSDGNFIVAGSTSSASALNSNIYFFKIASSGDTLWTKTYGESGTAMSMVRTLDGNFITAGYRYSLANATDVYLMKITPNGDSIWTKTYGGPDYETVEAISATNDGNFIVVAQTSANNGDAYILKIKPNGDTLWTKTFGGANFDKPRAIAASPEGDFIVAGDISSAGKDSIWLFSIINDRYDYKDSLFSFKIPISGDSLTQNYLPLKVPSGMTISSGGTISWTPKTDSVYMEHVEFLVADDFGNKDTLTFNIFVNSSNHPTAIKPLAYSVSNKNQSFGISQISASQIKFKLPSSATALDIFDMRGKQVQHISPTGSFALWNKTTASGTPVPAGKYFAKIKEGNSVREQGFMVVR